MLACIWVFTLHECQVPAEARRNKIPWNWRLQMSVYHHVSAGNTAWVSCRNSQSSQLLILQLILQYQYSIDTPISKEKNEF